MLHLAHAQRVHRAQWVDFEAVLGRLRSDALRHLGQRLGLVQAQPDVFGHGERVEQAEVLEHHGNAQLPRLLRVADVHHAPIHLHRPFVRLDGAVDDLHQRGLARAVLAQHGMDFARAHRQGHATVRHHGRVALGDAGQLQPQRGRRGAAGKGSVGGMHGADCLSNCHRPYAAKRPDACPMRASSYAFGSNATARGVHVRANHTKHRSFARA